MRQLIRLKMAYTDVDNVMQIVGSISSSGPPSRIAPSVTAIVGRPSW